jgi:uncharacterized protein
VFIDEFIDFVEALNLMIGGVASHNKFDFFVVAEGRYDSPNEDDRAAIKKWFSDNSKCSSIEVGALVDANLCT